MCCKRLNRFINLLMNNYTNRQFSTFFRRHGWNRCPLLIQVYWERKWRTVSSNKFYVLPYVSVFPPDDTCVALAPLRLSKHCAKNVDSQPDPKDTEFWMTSKTPILWLFILHSGSTSVTGTKSEGRKGRKRGEGKRDAGVIWKGQRYI